MEVFCFLYGVGMKELSKRWISLVVRVINRSFFLWSSPSDMEVLEDFSPLSTNATYWKTNQDTSEGAMPRCRMRDACGGCAKGKYSQISGEERGCFPHIDTKMEGGADFP